MFDYQDWTFHANGRTVVARVELDGDGGGIINRYQVTPGPAQSGLCIRLRRRTKPQKLEAEVNKLLGPSGSACALRCRSIATRVRGGTCCPALQSEQGP